MTGFSITNLWYIVQFYTEYQADINLVLLVREISWGKHLVILSKCKDLMHATKEITQKLIEWQEYK
jgi:hypothetical protein